MTIPRRAVVRYLVAAVAVGAAALVLAFWGRLERRVADAEHELATLDLAGAERILDDVDARLAVTARTPWLLPALRRSVTARRAETRYWRGEYAALVADYPDPGYADVRDNLPLQLTLAGAEVRAGELAAGDDRPARLGGLDRAINAYRQVLESRGVSRDAAYNYEYLVRVRDALAAGEEVPPATRATPLGTPGGSGEDEMDMLGDMNDIQIYVPSDMLGRESTDEPTVGSDAPIRRRG